MTHREFKNRLKAITRVRTKHQPSVDDQLAQLLTAQEKNPLLPMPWEERLDTDEPD